MNCNCSGTRKKNSPWSSPSGITQWASTHSVTTSRGFPILHQLQSTLTRRLPLRRLACLRGLRRNLAPNLPAHPMQARQRQAQHLLLLHNLRTQIRRSADLLSRAERPEEQRDLVFEILALPLDRLRKRPVNRPDL